MATISNDFIIKVIAQNVPPATGSALPFLVFDPPVAEIKQGSSQVVSVKVDNGNGVITNPTGFLSPFWANPKPSGVEVFIVNTSSGQPLQFRVEVASTAALNPVGFPVRIQLTTP